MKTEFERRKEKNIPTIAADFDGLWRELVTTFKNERVYLDVIAGGKYGIMPNRIGGHELVKYNFAKGYSGSVPFTYEEISDSEYNEVERDFNKGMVSVWWLRGIDKAELHRATGSPLV